ncbi:HNH endonuclease [Brachybacterium endophyticum]|uniref:HNH endonuclease n=1 Tax=Brachybacterium endophyticum TaxID=2182385 RepID=A0A2U2RNS1_9MICO|nr:HNH endonuclease signature motif containing protein [Brachybacterium endophyticum]PWH07520.1 HNH endonuclease [Brachybacterium endophyticum]
MVAQNELDTCQGALDISVEPSVFAILDELETLTPAQREKLAAPDPAEADRLLPEGVKPLRRVTATKPLTRESAPRRVAIRPDIEVVDRVHHLWDDGVEESCALARRFLMLAPSWMDRDCPEVDELEVEAEDLAVATSLRCTLGAARDRVRDAHRAIHLLPRCTGALEEGEFPADWFRRFLERTRDLTDEEMFLVDTTVCTWALGITPETFTRELNRLVATILSARERPPHLEPEARRRMTVTPGKAAGTACLRIIGPVPEIQALSRRFDETARAVQDAQRQALRDGTEIPCDPDGQVEREGMPLSLNLLRYHLAHGATLDAHGVDVPASRFRLNVMVPFLTLMGGDEVPATMEDGTPIPADMARDLAGSCPDWHRVLTDPSDGEFLPLKPTTYRPTQSMLEHLRLRNRSCAVPGCARSTSAASEADHIVEYDHEDPRAGGLTEIENLHLLCWHHHAMKTAGLLDPERISAEDSPTGRRGTRWSIREQVTVFREDDADLLTPEVATELIEVWEDFERRLATHQAAAAPPRRTDAPDPATVHEAWTRPSMIEHEVTWRQFLAHACPEPEPDPDSPSPHRPSGPTDTDVGPPPF